MQPGRSSLSLAWLEEQDCSELRCCQHIPTFRDECCRGWSTNVADAPCVEDPMADLAQRPELTAGVSVASLKRIQAPQHISPSDLCVAKSFSRALHRLPSHHLEWLLQNSHALACSPPPPPRGGGGGVRATVATSCWAYAASIIASFNQHCPCLQSLEQLELVEKDTEGRKGGRRITGKGQQDLDLIASRLTQEMPEEEEEEEAAAPADE